MQMGLFRIIALALSKTLSKLFGVATIAFFGRMPSRDDDKAAGIGLLSVSWLVLPVAIVFPEVTKVIVPFLPDDESLLRGVAVALTVAVPLGVGWLISRLHNRRNLETNTLVQMVSGYVYTPLVGLLVLALVVVVPATRIAYLFRLFEMQHLAIMVRSGDFDDVVDEIVDALARDGIEVERTAPRKALWWVFRILSLVEGRIFRRDFAREMILLRGDVDGEHLEITVHGADLAIVGPRSVVTRARAVLSEELSEERMYFTWDDQSQALEDEILALRHRLDAGEEVGHDEVLALQNELRSCELDADEWNALRRHLYALERDCYRLASQAGQASSG